MSKELDDMIAKAKEDHAAGRTLPLPHEAAEAKFWDRALTAEEIATLAKGGEVPGGQAVAPRHEEISMKDIVERLRDAFNPEYWTSEIRTEAADEIERLTAFYDEGTMTLASLRKDLLHASEEIERLRRDREYWHTRYAEVCRALAPQGKAP